MDRVDAWAVVLFVDFGQSATVPVRCLRSLEGADFWTIPPLTQPFMLENGKMPSDLRPPASSGGSGVGDAVSASRTSVGEGVGAAEARRVPFSLWSFDLCPVFGVCLSQSCLLGISFHTWLRGGRSRCCPRAGLSLRAQGGGRAGSSPRRLPEPLRV